MRRLANQLMVVVCDIILINLSFLLAMYLRFDGEIPAVYLLILKTSAPFYTIFLCISLYLFKSYNHIYRYFSFRELKDIINAITLGMVAVFIFSLTILPHRIPHSVILIAYILQFVFLVGIRACIRVFFEKVNKRATGNDLPKKVLIVGAGDAGVMVAKEISHNPKTRLHPIGFVDDSPLKQKMNIHGLPVLGNSNDIPRLVEVYNVQQIIIAIPSASGEAIRGIVDLCRTTGVPTKIIPGVYELLDEKVTIKRMRDVQVEDLLGREPVQIDLNEVTGYLTNRVVMVTGAGGSIGSELCRQIAKLKPRKLILLGRGENSIYEIDSELRDLYPTINVEPEIANIRDRYKINYLFEKYRPEVVFHAAAHKHVPLMERNPEEAVKNNIFGTLNLAEAADRFGSEVFILISTDKAVNPTSVMGATKRVAEMVIQQMNKLSTTKFAAVRFGNVLGSRGSVIPRFKKQIAMGGPVTVTHPDMVRYFMTIPEAARLVLQAGAMTKGGEIFVLDMGNPVKILDLARDLIELSGLKPDQDIRIEFTGIRPGEKLYEEVLTTTENAQSTKHKRIFISKLDEPCFSLFESVSFKALQKGQFSSEEEVVELLHKLVPSYQVGNPQTLHRKQKEA